MAEEGASGILMGFALTSGMCPTSSLQSALWKDSWELQLLLQGEFHISMVPTDNLLFLEI